MAKHLSLLPQSNYTTNSTKDLITKIKNKKIPKNHKMVLFDQKTLFTSVPLEHTIVIIIKRIYENTGSNNSFYKTWIEETMNITYEKAHFSCNNEIYIQIDGVVVGSPLGPVIAIIFMTESESILVPNLDNRVKNWRRFVDDGFLYIKNELNSFHDNIKFSYKQKEKYSLAFLYVLSVRDCEKITPPSIWNTHTKTFICIGSYFRQLRGNEDTKIIN